jgi:hypothetical protein
VDQPDPLRPNTTLPNLDHSCDGWLDFSIQPLIVLTSILSGWGTACGRLSRPRRRFHTTVLWVVGSVGRRGGLHPRVLAARQGFQPTVVERAHGLRTSGNPVEIRGPALRVAAARGIAPRLCEAATQTTAMTLIGSAGRQVARVALPATRNGAQAREIVPRGELAAIMSEAARDDAELLFGDEIVALDRDEHGVDVTLASAPQRRFDLVLGATACTPPFAAWLSARSGSLSGTRACTWRPCRSADRSTTRTR